jgi:hypothetical protein
MNTANRLGPHAPETQKVLDAGLHESVGPAHEERTSPARCAVANGSASGAWEVEINYISCIVFAATKAKAKWLAVKAYWDAYSRTQGWPYTSVARRPQYDRFPYREPKAYSPDYVRDLC